MALKHTFIFGGVSIDGYVKIAHLNIDNNSKSAQAELSYHGSKGHADRFPMPTYETFFIDVPIGDGDPMVSAYEHLMSLELFDGAEKC